MKIAFILVVYNEVFYNTKTYKTLIESIDISAYPYLTVLVYDNSDVKKWKVDYSTLPLKDRIYYYHNANNPGLSTAYNYMAKHAHDNGIEWIVLLDQDTSFPENAINVYVSAIKNEKNIFIKTPLIYTGDVIFSPMRYIFVKTIKKKSMSPGVYLLRKYTVINSGLLINVNFFRKVGGYNERIKLDFSDIQFMVKVKKHLSCFELLPIICQHDYSYNSSNLPSALKRYKSYLQDHSNCKMDSLTNNIAHQIVNIIHVKNLTFKYHTFKFIRLYFNHLLRK